MNNDFSPSSLNHWMLETFNDHNLDDAIVLRMDGSLASVNPNIAIATERNRVFSRKVSTYLERHKNLLKNHFVKTSGIIKELKKLEDYTVKLRGKDTILKRDLFSGSLQSLTSTLLNSPALELIELKREILKSAATPWSKDDLKENLMKFYNCLYELYKNHLITIQGFHGILAELPFDIQSHLKGMRGDYEVSILKLNQILVAQYVDQKKYDLALLKLIEPDRGVLFTDDNFKLHNYVQQLSDEEIGAVIAGDPQKIAPHRAWMDAVTDKKISSTGSVFDRHERDMQLRSGKKIATETSKVSVSEQKRQLRIRLRNEQAEKSFVVKPENPVFIQSQLAEEFRRLYKVCESLELDSTVTDQILTLDFQSMSVDYLDHTLKNQCGLDNHQARLILECVKTPDEIDALMCQRESIEQNGRRSPATTSCAVEHEFREHEVVILPGDTMGCLAQQGNSRVFEVIPVPDDPMPAVVPKPAPSKKKSIFGEISLELLANTLIMEITRECPDDEIPIYSSIILDHIGNIKLSRKQVNNVMRGDKRTINYVLRCCEFEESKRRSMKTSGQVSAAREVEVIDVDAVQNLRIYGDVALRVRAGIQASDNNCGLAAFFMSMSNNGLLDQLIDDAKSRVAALESLNDDRASHLNSLVDILNHFNPRDGLDQFIPNSGLDYLRLRYRLRVARLKPGVIEDICTKKEEIVTLRVETEFQRGADLKEANRSAYVTFDFFWHDDNFSAKAIILPSPDMGLMLIRGHELKLRQQYNADELRELEFVPLGEILEPIEFIHPILNEIYDFNNGEPEQSSIDAIWQKSTTSFRQKVSIVEMQGDCRTDEVSSLPSKDFSNAIPAEVIPDGFILDPTKTVSNPHPFLENVVGNLVEHYFKDGVLRLKLTRDLHHSSQDENRRTYEFFDENGMFEKKTICEVEKHFADNQLIFIRAKETEFIGDGGERKRIELRMFGYSQERPDEGEVRVKIMHRASNFQEMLNIFVDSLKDRFLSSKDVLLPDEQHSPEFIFMTIPNEGKEQRCYFDCQTGVNLPMAGGGEKFLHYDVSALFWIKENHYVCFIWDQTTGLIHYANSIGETDPKLGSVPIVVTMPDKDPAEKLRAACCLSSAADVYFLAGARDKLMSLGQHVALVILKKRRN